MIFEHFALNVSEPQKIAQWYVKHCGLKILKQTNYSPFIHFLGDENSRVFLELYHNTKAEIPDYFTQSPLKFHLAFYDQKPVEMSNYLKQQGAVFIEEIKPDADTHLVMMRDPWGIPLQICKRTNSFF